MNYALGVLRRLLVAVLMPVAILTLPFVLLVIAFGYIFFDMDFNDTLDDYVDFVERLPRHV